MSVARTVLVAGPAKVVRGSLITYTRDDVQIRHNHSVFPVTTSAFGTIDHRSLDQIVEATFTPSGEWNAVTRAGLWPYADFTKGASIFTTSDVPTVFHGADGTGHSITASAITQMPSIRLSAAEPMIGPCTITGIRGTGTNYGTADSMYDETAAGTSFANTSFDPTEILTQNFTAVWGGTTDVPGFSASTPFNTVDGWTIDFSLTLTPIVVDELGTVDMRYEDLVVTARCIPLGPTVTQIMNAANFQGTGGTASARGRSVNNVLAVGTTPDLVITGADSSTIITLKEAGINDTGFNFGSGTLRYGEVQWIARRPFSSGAQQPIFTLA